MSTIRNRTVDQTRRAPFVGAFAAQDSAFAPDLLRLDEVPATPIRLLHVKRAVDLLFSLLVIPALLVPGLLIAASIAVTSKGPVFYREERIGRNGRPFRIWKFRSMHADADQRGRLVLSRQAEHVLPFRMRKHAKDPRTTAIGHFLRVWSLDEIPQFLNVLAGEMSLIGPRPIVKAELYLYGALLHYYLQVKPGLSGLWQVSGRSNLDYGKRAQLDAKYVRTWSLFSDLHILLMTIPAVLRRDGSI